MGQDQKKKIKTPKQAARKGGDKEEGKWNPVASKSWTSLLISAFPISDLTSITNAKPTSLFSQVINVQWSFWKLKKLSLRATTFDKEMKPGD